MLHLRIKAYDNLDLLYRKYKIKQEQNIDALFMKIKMQVTPETKQLVKDIESCELVSKNTFRDKFGNHRDIDDLSQGCKAALLVYCGDTEIDFTSSGQNAIEAAIKIIKNGKMVIPTPIFITEPDVYHKLHIDVELNGYRFEDIMSLNSYLQNRWPYEPNPNVLGVTQLDPYNED